MAQLGDHARAKELLHKAARAFGNKEAVARARCVVAEAEIALASRDLSWPVAALDMARTTLEEYGDWVNAAHARHLSIRRLLLFGRIDEAERALADVDSAQLPQALRAVNELVIAGIAMRRLKSKLARAALVRAERAARQARIPALVSEIEGAALLLNAPAARLVASNADRLLKLDEVEALLASKTFVVDACRHAVRYDGEIVPLAKRPVLFALARALAEAWPGDVPRDVLIARVFRLKLADESHRARLRVEMGRLRSKLRPLARINATKQGFALSPNHARRVAVLARPVEEKHAVVLALLTDGESWSSSALALVLGVSQRTVQRSIDELAAASKIHAVGYGRARRWMMPPALGFTTTLLLPGPPAFD